jgi:hypothetical protein
LSEPGFFGLNDYKDYYLLKFLLSSLPLALANGIKKADKGFSQRLFRLKPMYLDDLVRPINGTAMNI